MSGVFNQAELSRQMIWKTVYRKCPDKWSRRLSINWNCPEDCFHRLSMNCNLLNHWFRVMYMDWNCWDNCFWRPSINWNCPDDCFRKQCIDWNCPNNRVLEGAVTWKLAATTVEYTWFGQYTTMPRYYCLYNRMGNFPVHPIIGKVPLYYALLRVVSIQCGVSISIQLIGTRSWHFSSDWFRGRPLKWIVQTIPINFQPPK